MPGGYSFNHVDTLKMIDLYYNSKYKSGQYDNLGYRKFFYNVVKPACDIATKFVDLDTKDIILMPEGNEDELKVWLMQKRFAKWMEDTEFASLLNTIGFNLPKYGSVVIMKTKEGWVNVNLQTLRFDPTVKSLNDSPYVYRIESKGLHEMPEAWDTKELVARGEEDTYIIYDCYNREGKKWRRTVCGDLFSTKTNKEINRTVESEMDNKEFFGATELFTELVDELPYREFHWERVPGRWLGYGFVEYLEENQIAINEAENLERKGLLFTSLKLWQTRDETIGGSNLLSMSQNGDVLTITSEITPIAMEERNLPAFNNTRTNWTANTERKTFTSDITTGANLPSRTPLGVANLQATFASSYFELKRESFGLGIKSLVIEDILPSFQKDTAKEHLLMIEGSDQDADLLDRIIVDTEVETKAYEYALKTGFYPSKMEKENVKSELLQSLKSDKNRAYKIPKDFYRNIKYSVKVNITGESVDNGTKSQVIQMALTIMAQQPAILQSRTTKNLFFSLLGLGGISPADLGMLSEEPQPQQQMMDQMAQGGSVAKPLPQMPGMGNATMQL